MSKFGWTGEISRVRPGAKETRTWTKEELERIQETERQFTAQRDQRFADGPAFRRRKVPRISFLQKYGAVVGGFLGTGCTFFFLITPLWGLFVKPLYSKAPPGINYQDPEGTLNKEIEICYKAEHWEELHNIRDNLTGRFNYCFRVKIN